MSPIRCAAFALAALAACSSPQRAACPAPRYTDVARELTRVVRSELEAKGLPALSIALVDRGEIVWAAGFGSADPEAGTPAGAGTVYRVGSISKLFTDIALMQLVERGAVDLDAPVQTYLPDFRPDDPFGRPITLRQLTAHRAGLVREPPVGNYFDDTEPTLAATVASLNATTLVARPGYRTKYSNAGIAVVGRVLEAQHGRGYVELMQDEVLGPMGLADAGFAPRPAIERRLAAARMWGYDGRELDAPTFQLGMAPAGSLYASVLDLAQFLRVVFAGGAGPGGRVLRAETLAEMLEPALGPEGEPTRFGIGFALGELDGQRQCGHGGAIYGFASELTFLPDEQLGAALATSMDVANAVTRRIGAHALRCMLAAREGRPLPVLALSEPVEPETAERLAGRYRSGDAEARIERRGARVMLEWGGTRAELRRLGDDLVLDDRHVFGTRVRPIGLSDVEIDGRPYERVPDAKPALGPEGWPEGWPERWRELLGEYGWDHNVLFVRERGGQLEALIEWIFFDALAEVEPDVFALPADTGLYPGERLVFRRDAEGRVTHALLGAVAFARRSPGAPDGETFRIEPLLAADELRARAGAASPPREEGRFREPELVDLTEVVPGVRLDVRYASTNNFMGMVFYPEARAFLQRPAAEALARAQAELALLGYGLLVHDAYRPWHVTKMFWDATPESMKLFVADPERGSRHNRGCAVDLTLCDLATGAPVAMTGGYDEFSERSYPDYPGGTSLQRWHRELLRRTMETHGFRVYEWEWWHFDFADWREYPILDVSFEDITAMEGAAR